ncbi:amino acid permease [uncultured Treponema sp.]|uniref:ATP-binding response regulator n=1 Tax=uncultured Treponema sp. TaxID=162155 RepID=UPI0025DE63CD|nr:amino acid permease [uncultured Treponema sp.]
MTEKANLERYISPAGAWALSFGSAVGWGAFVMPGTTFLPIAGPVGTALGMAFGSLIMLLIGANYHFMINRYDDAGGTYSYTKNIFGYDHAFLSAWFLSLTYIAITWANVTALALIARNIFGTLFQFGFYYSIAGYSIYFGEVLLEISMLIFITLTCIFAKRTAVIIQTVLAFLLIFGVLWCFFTIKSSESFNTVFNHAFNNLKSMDKPLIQVISIAALSPWAFIGFESISHSSREFRFSRKKSLPIMFIAIFAGFAAYTLLTYTAVPAYNLVSMPVFFAIKTFAGQTGTIILSLAVFGAIITGIIGNLIAASRLLYSMADDGILPSFFKKTSSKGVPVNAILLISITCAIIPFLGRTAIGWIVDVTTIGAAISYGYTSACAYKIAKTEKNLIIKLTGITGIVSAIFFSLFLMVPNFWSINALSPESYLILACWSVFGFLYFRTVFTNDKERRFGKSTIVWIVLIFMVFFTSIMWMRQKTHKTTETVLNDINEFYVDEMQSRGFVANRELQLSATTFINSKLSVILDELMNNSLVQLVMIIVALGIMFSVYSRMRSREKILEEEKLEAHRANKAKTAFLSNMSHDIRTPMNAIIGYTKLAQKEGVSLQEMREFLSKIDSSSKHLLALINDVLEMSRIESGKMEIEESPCDFRELLKEVQDIFATQMSIKRINFNVDCENLHNPKVWCDKNRLNRVLLNLLSNAYKFTPEDGEVTLKILQTGEEKDGISSYEIIVKDSGIGMSKEFAERAFEAFERERTSTVSGIQGTGLGMAITKSIIDLMGGEITVNTEQGKGTEFVIQLTLRVQESSDTQTENCENLEQKANPEQPNETKDSDSNNKIDFTKKRLLLVDDVEVNREIAAMLLGEMGFMVETSVNGKDALQKVESMPSDYFDAILMDIQMPEMNGYEATKHIRLLSDKQKAEIPIIAMTANAFEEDKRNAYAAGMNAHVAKPIDEERLLEVLNSVLK